MPIIIIIIIIIIIVIIIIIMIIIITIIIMQTRYLGKSQSHFLDCCTKIIQLLSTLFVFLFFLEPALIAKSNIIVDVKPVRQRYTFDLYYNKRKRFTVRRECG